MKPKTKNSQIMYSQEYLDLLIKQCQKQEQERILGIIEKLKILTDAGDLEYLGYLPLEIVYVKDLKSKIKEQEE